MTKPKFCDVLFFTLSLAAVVFSIGNIQKMTGESLLVSVECNGQEWIYPLNENKLVAIDGEIGKTYIQIEDNEAKIIDSPCLNKTCVACSPISKPGEWIICLPNKVFLRIKGSPSKKTNDIDVFGMIDFPGKSNYV